MQKIQKYDSITPTNNSSLPNSKIIKILVLIFCIKLSWNVIAAKKLNQNSKKLKANHILVLINLLLRYMSRNDIIG